ncbi:hypothetical protein SS50377_20370 [Spironucleus salmonicida]|uniref:Uncharacterized protein n=1 Tax=Spironucleus salmonicida TaxID=348837 RepID=V6LQL6_9EUKA|nr:hypothetical protein SS50377_20370 [Spironucleus salmonicida]|eukprot:EST43049.1 Hypothetical protein SS50377_17352 [Spironucleus salmonicida]
MSVGMSQVMRLHYDSQDEIDQLEEYIQSVKVSYKINLNPDREAISFGYTQISKFTPELFNPLAWTIKDATFPYSLISGQNSTNHACLYVDPRRFGVACKIWGNMNVHLEGDITDVIGAMHATQSYFKQCFAQILPGYIVSYDELLLFNMRAHFELPSVSSQILRAGLLEFRDKNASYKMKDSLDELSDQYIITYELITKKIDGNSRNSMKSPQITITCDTVDIIGSLPVDKLIPLRDQLILAFEKVSGKILK